MGTTWDGIGIYKLMTLSYEHIFSKKCFALCQAGLAFQFSILDPLYKCRDGRFLNHEG